MDVTVLITIGVLAAALGIVLGRYVWPAVRAVTVMHWPRLKQRLPGSNQECIALRSRADQLDAEHKAAAAEAKRAGRKSHD